MILKSKKCFLDLLIKGIYVYTFIKINIVFFGRKIEMIVLLRGRQK